MKNLPKLALSKIVDGFLLLLPFLLTYLMMGQLFDGMMALATPIADVLPIGVFTTIWALRFAAAGLLVIICLFVGLAMETPAARSVGKWIEDKFLNRIPPYVILRSLARRISGRDVPDQLQPALVSIGPEIRTLAFIVEEHTDGYFTVFVPLAPTPGVGTLQIVNSSKVDKLDSSIKDALGCIMNWGTGIEALLKPKKAGSG